MLGAFPHADSRAALIPYIIVIGIGNDFRRDDGVGLTVAQRIAERDLPGVRVVNGVSDPAALLDVWGGAARAVVVDAATGANPAPGRIRRWTGLELESTAVVSSHALGLAQTCALGQAVSRMPDELVVFTVDVADTNHGIGLTPAVAAAVPDLVDLIVAELNR
jgi:hydrogenase maturation protease